MQVEVIRTYTAKQPDELSLQVADVVLLSQTVEDGTLALDASLAFFTHPLKYSSHLPPSCFKCVLKLSPSRYLSVSHKQTSYLCEDVLSDLHEHTEAKGPLFFLMMTATGFHVEEQTAPSIKSRETTHDETQQVLQFSCIDSISSSPRLV